VKKKTTFKKKQTHTLCSGRNMKRNLAIIALAVLTLTSSILFPLQMNTNSVKAQYSTNGTRIVLETSMGNITIQLRDDKPITTQNFVNLIKGGFYDGTIFHRVLAGFVIQGGRNLTANVPAIVDEIGNDNHNYNGTIAMAKTSQPNSATSQFFINVADNSKITYSDNSSLDSTYAVFGQVIGGMDVAMGISRVQVQPNPEMQNEISQPVQQVTLIKAVIESSISQPSQTPNPTSVLTASVAESASALNFGNKINFTVSADGGTKPYTYAWYVDNQWVQTSNSEYYATNTLAVGSHGACVQVTDAKNSSAKTLTVSFQVLPALSSSPGLSSSPSPSVPELPSFVALSFLTIATILTLILYKGKNDSRKQKQHIERLA
jgi:cyclophilin family peptidyl-prolyl cis-trans isomerase